MGAGLQLKQLTCLSLTIQEAERAPGRVEQLLRAQAALSWWFKLHIGRGLAPAVAGVEDPLATVGEARTILNTLFVRSILAASFGSRADRVELWGDDAKELACATGRAEISEDGKRVLGEALVGFEVYQQEKWASLPKQARAHYRPVEVDLDSLSVSISDFNPETVS